MEFADLDQQILSILLYELQTTYSLDVTLDKFTTEYGVTIPRWLIIKYRCGACSKETRSRIQTINVRQMNKMLTCPFCRKPSRIFTIHTDKGDSILTP